MYLTRAGFPVEVARLIEWFRRVSQIRIEYFMRGLPPLSVSDRFGPYNLHEPPRDIFNRRGKMRGHFNEDHYWGYLQ